MVKRLSLADRIRAQRQTNRSKDEVDTEKALVQTIKLVKNNTIEGDRPSDLVTQWPSDRPSDLVGDLVTQRPSGLESDLVTHLVTQWPSDLVAQKNQKNITSKITPKKPDDLTERQFKVLEYIYFNRPFRVYTDKGLGAIYGIGPNNARNQLKWLVKKGYIFKPYSINDGVLKGSTCRVVEEKCMPIFGPSTVPNPPEKKLSKSGLVTQWPSDPVTDLVDSSYNSSSSFLLKNKTTTNTREYSGARAYAKDKPNCGCDLQAEKIISEIMQADPEYKYWLDHQVLPKQVTGWKDEFGLDIETILKNLCYVRWQILKQKSSINKSPAHYLFGIMQKSGGVVNKPSGYKTMAELDLEFFENWKKERNAYILQRERMRAELVKTEIEPKVNELLEKPDPENELIKSAIEKIRTESRRKIIMDRLASGKPLDSTSEGVLKGHLVEMLCSESLRKVRLDHNRRA